MYWKIVSWICYFFKPNFLFNLVNVIVLENCELNSQFFKIGQHLSKFEIQFGKIYRIGQLQETKELLGSAFSALKYFTFHTKPPRVIIAVFSDRFWLHFCSLLKLRCILDDLLFELWIIKSEGLVEICFAKSQFIKKYCRFLLEHIEFWKVNIALVKNCRFLLTHWVLKVKYYISRAQQNLLGFFNWDFFVLNWIDFILASCDNLTTK